MGTTSILMIISFMIVILNVFNRDSNLLPLLTAVSCFITTVVILLDPTSSTLSSFIWTVNTIISVATITNKL